MDWISIVLLTTGRGSNPSPATKAVYILLKLHFFRSPWNTCPDAVNPTFFTAGAAVASAAAAAAAASSSPPTSNTAVGGGTHASTLSIVPASSAAAATGGRNRPTLP